MWFQDAGIHAIPDRDFSAGRTSLVQCLPQSGSTVHGWPCEIPIRLLSWNFGVRLVGLLQFVTGIWRMYCTYAMTVDLALGAKAGV
jgi:hypothetical protein